MSVEPHPRPQSRPHTSRTALRAGALAGTAVLAAALTACSGGSGPSGGGAAGAGQDGKAKPETRITVNLTGKEAAPGSPVKVSLAEGTLKQVTVTDSQGAVLAGEVAADGRSWTSARGAAPGTGYTVEARDAGGGTAKAEFATAAAQKVNKLTLAPGKNTTVGIAQPLSIVFDHPVKNKAAVERR